MKKGSYLLLIELEKDAKIELGVGSKLLEKGFYVYFGSAFGTGGLKRVQRHREVSEQEREVRHWHIDYLTGLKTSELIDAMKFPSKDIECELANKAREEVDAFGSTDCSCSSHLAYFTEEESAKNFIGELKAEYLDS